jgi:hypothetical protein
VAPDAVEPTGDGDVLRSEAEVAEVPNRVLGLYRGIPAAGYSASCSSMVANGAERLDGLVGDEGFVRVNPVF